VEFPITVRLLPSIAVAAISRCTKPTKASETARKTSTPATSTTPIGGRPRAASDGRRRDTGLLLARGRGAIGSLSLAGPGATQAGTETGHYGWAENGRYLGRDGNRPIRTGRRPAAIWAGTETGQYGRGGEQTPFGPGRKPATTDGTGTGHYGWAETGHYGRGGERTLFGPGRKPATTDGTENGRYLGRDRDRPIQHGIGVNKTPWWRGEYSSTRVWLVGEAVWFAIGTTAGLGGAIHPVAPDFFTNIPSLEFGRIRQFHANMVLFGFVTAVLIGGGLYIVPRVLNTRLYSEAIANLGALLFNSAALIGGIGILTGRTQGREYAEYVCSVDWLIVIAFILMGIVTVMTIVRREENLPYTSA
jgi:hypothetical protein